MPNSRVCGFLTAVGWSLLAFTTARAADAVDYATQIKPLLESRCYACHGVLKQESSLRLDTAALAKRGGDSGAAVVPGDADASILLERVSAEDEYLRMPPEGEPLKAAEIAAIRTWIEQGANAPADEQPEPNPRDHWSFRTPVRPAVPTVSNAEWARNPIDAFIAAEHEQRGLRPQQTADRRVWLRRVSLDLIGLPPTRAELDAFVADESPDAYDRVVTRLLDSPQYGQRWGRHWMDIWRYSDWWGLGAEVRNSQKHIWHWRDWIIESLNADKGYDQMVREMLAADELYPNDLDRLRATGFLARQYFKFNRTTWLDDVVEHTAKAMLGLTFNCAKCHDHKYDPISHAEYYQFRAFFEPYQIRTEMVPGEVDFEKNGIPRAFDCNLEATTYLHIRGDDRNPDKSRVIVPGLPALLLSEKLTIAPVTLPPAGHHPGLRPFVVESYLEDADARIAAARTAMETARKQLAETERAAKLAEANKTDSPSATSKAEPTVRDDFTSDKPNLWTVGTGQWSYAGGRLVQSQTGATRAAIRLRTEPPADFEATLTYIPRGGEKWKSVGISFDVDETHEVLVYLSSYAGGPKSQISYRAGGGPVYPPGAAQRRPVDLDKPHELTVRVRGTLINVEVDGEHSIAWRLPHARRRGALELITFDAKAEFQSFALAPLPADRKLVSPSKSDGSRPEAPASADEARLALRLAEKGLAALEAERASIVARAAADRARYLSDGSADAAGAIAAAVRAERLAAVAEADEEVARAELEQLRAVTTKKAEADKKLAAAKSKLETARKQLDEPGETYTSLAGAMKTLESNVETEASRRKPFPQTSTGRRTALAEWITDRQNPLAARVAVNHLWSRHFGRPLVATVFDFGRKGAAPSHPELLDWLAVELMENGWSMKHIHRLIVTSNTYRLSSSNAGAPEESLAGDPENRYYWRANPVRMESQVIRDSLLHLAGELDLSLGGPSIPVDKTDSRRRALYFVHSHNDHNTFLSMFDDANVLDCYRRAESIVPQQALALENSALAVEMATTIAEQLTAGTPGIADRDFVHAAFLTVLSVEPTEAEVAAVLEALAELTQAAEKTNQPNTASRARVGVVLALLNHNDFVTIR